MMQFRCSNAVDLAAFCQRWGVVELALFGSALRDDFGPDSDIDVLVNFEERARHTLLDMVRMQDELTQLFDRRADVLEHAEVDASPNYIRLESILGSAETIHAA